MVWPTFHLPQVDFTILPMFVPVVLVLVAENVGHVKSVSQMTGRDYDDQIGTALFADGLGTTIAGFGGGSGTTTYGENIGVMAATKVYSTGSLLVRGWLRTAVEPVPEVRCHHQHDSGWRARWSDHPAVRHDRHGRYSYLG